MTSSSVFKPGSLVKVRNDIAHFTTFFVWNDHTSFRMGNMPAGEMSGLDLFIIVGSFHEEQFDDVDWILILCSRTGAFGWRILEKERTIFEHV
jgi:hypothetical protein